ncbi:DUF3099 domain-containing protein [Arthrobacter sp. zg-Y1143]|uniref:DUF3099 domain-containing protein n=1 Tax=Arthrobacter sp. zg-Y1143 TaxID=3049065 RepID=UPI0024C20C69|nr:DUF3099 domain-containing protein [Arthrobacter sp. zg-Y1143]MDK1327749.1 DUF3099 domain-containing protein [Arthrobacter sp. zg-Y1143]
MAKDTNRGDSVPRITAAPNPHTDEMHARMIKYGVSMGIRVVCLFLLFFVHGWLLWVVIAGAVVLPYFAVIMANGGADTRNMQASDAMINQPPAAAIDAPAPPPDTAHTEESPETSVVPGEIVENTDDDDDDDDKA